MTTLKNELPYSWEIFLKTALKQDQNTQLKEAQSSMYLQ